MRAKIGAMVAAVAAAASAAGAAAWAKRKKDEDKPDLEVTETHEATVVEKASEVDKAPVVADSAEVADAADDLTTIKGIGAINAERLHGVGVTTFAQIAAWSDDDIAEIAPQIKVNGDRIAREDWVGQARAAIEG